jgi:hypothetical protein
VDGDDVVEVEVVVVTKEAEGGSRKEEGGEKEREKERSGGGQERDLQGAPGPGGPLIGPDEEKNDEPAPGKRTRSALAHPVHARFLLLEKMCKI